jgi:hypothetical protein
MGNRTGSGREQRGVRSEISFPYKLHTVVCTDAFAHPHTYIFDNIKLYALINQVKIKRENLMNEITNESSCADISSFKYPDIIRRKELFFSL